ncbi:MAG: hypothetical protein NTV34_03650 [Proteobacteria bacterium]|nr:hypothetical protein [Pseudomonadota bacterium]
MLHVDTVSKTLQLLLALGLFTLGGPVSPLPAAELTEDALVFKNEVREFRSRRALLENVASTARAIQSHNKYVYELGLKLPPTAIAALELEKSRITFIRSTLVVLEAEHSIGDHVLRERMSKLKAEWEVGTRIKVLADLAGLYLEMRQLQVGHAQTIAEQTDAIAASLMSERDILRHLAQTNSISAEEVHEIETRYTGAKENALNNWASLAAAKIELEDAKKDLEAVQH